MEWARVMVVKSLIAQLELDGAGVQAVLAQAAADHLAEPRQGGFEQAGDRAVSSEKVCSWLMDLGSASVADFGIEPAAGVEAARFAGQRQAPFAEALFQEALVEAREIADLADAEVVQVLLGDLADAGDAADVERRQEARFLAGDDPQDAVAAWPGRKQTSPPGARSAMPMEQLSCVARLHRVVQQVRGAQRRAVQALGAGHVEIGFVDRGHLHQRREAAQHLEDLAGVLAVAVGMAVDENGLRAELGGGAQRHGGMHAEFAGLVGCRGDHAALVGPAARPPPACL